MRSQSGLRTGRGDSLESETLVGAQAEGDPHTLMGVTSVSMVKSRPIPAFLLGRGGNLVKIQPELSARLGPRETKSSGLGANRGSRERPHLGKELLQKSRRHT